MPELMYDQFKIISKRLINNEDITSLTKLYLPLMGMDSYSLYLGLSTLDTNVSYNYKTLLDILGFRSVKNINTASHKLEALGLIDVYENSKKDYVYVMYRPYTFKEFFKEEALKTLLISQIGETEVSKMETECLYSIRGYKKISKKFSDVFETTFSKPLDIINNLVPHEIEIQNDDFNYSLFKMLFDTEFINEDILNDETFKSNIIRISFIYKLSEEEMKDAVIGALDIDKDLDYSSISNSARRIFRSKKKDGQVKLVTKESDDYLSSIKDDQTLALCNWLENVSPTEVLENLSGIKPSSAEVKLCEDLVNNTKLPVSVINFMLLMVSKEKDGEIPGYSYFEKIANTWRRAKIKNVNDALNYLDKKHESASNNTKSYYKKPEKLPEWYDTYSKELDKKLSDNKEMNQEEVKDILSQAKDLFGE